LTTTVTEVLKALALMVLTITRFMRMVTVELNNPMVGAVPVPLLMQLGQVMSMMMGREEVTPLVVLMLSIN
jgi:hypothetical protein